MLVRRHSPILLTLFLLVCAGGQAQDREEKNYYRHWLERDALYIITPQEEAVFKSLTTDEEKQQFIEQFWNRRDPHPATAENEFKLEHYRRIAYANEAFAAGIPGWKSDRGRTYIMFGPPDEIETHTGGAHSRRIEEGGGGTSVFPFERWYYRHLPGVGDGIELEFVDDTGGSLYRLALDQHTKDALFYTPTSGLTLAESSGLVEKGTRVLNRFVTNPQRLGFEGALVNDPIKPRSFQNAPFERLYRLFDLQKPPRREFRDLQTEVLTSISYQQQPFAVSAGLTYVDSDGALAPVTVEIDPQELTFTAAGETRRARVAIYTRVESLDRRIVKESERELELTLAPNSPSRLAAFQYSIPLRPGLYKITTVAKDTASGKMGVDLRSLHVSALPQERPHFSSILLARSLRPAEIDEGPLDPFRVGRLKVHVNAAREFRRDDPIGFYVELYNAGSSDPASTPKLSARLVDDAGFTKWEALNLNRELGRIGPHLYLAKEVRLPHLSPGRYRLVLELQDRSGQVISEGSATLVLKQ